jgi:uncharacterized protein YycO
VIGGKVGRYVAAAQAFTGDGSRYTHAFLVLDGGEIVEAMPHGARIVPLADRADDPGGVVYCDPVDIYLRERGHWGDLDRREAIYRNKIVEFGRTLVGIPYNYWSYLYIGLSALGIRAGWVRKRVSSNKQLICSQLVDYAYMMNGIHLFDDGRLPGTVTPGDLDYYRARNYW